MANNMWVPHLHVQSSLPGSAFNLGFRFNSLSDADLTDYNGEFEGSYIAWFVESVRTGAAMCGDPLTITGFTLDDAVSTPDPYAIGIMAMIPEMEWDTTFASSSVTIAELVNGADLATGVGVRIALSTTTAGTATITATIIDAGTPVGGSGTASASLPAGYYPLDAINIVALRSGDGSVINLLVSIGGCVPVPLVVSDVDMVTLPPTKIVLSNVLAYGVTVLEDASAWGGLTEDSFESMADLVIVNNAASGGGTIYTGIRIGL